MKSRWNTHTIWNVHTILPSFLFSSLMLLMLLSREKLEASNSNFGKKAVIFVKSFVAHFQEGKFMDCRKKFYMF